MPKLIVDGIEVEVPAGATVMQACEMAGKEIPRFCYHERLSIAGNCRMCLVEQERAPKPIASCAMPAAEGMVIHTDTPKVKKAREGVMEFLLINHPLDCPICDQGGECDLQDQAMAYGKGYSRFDENKRAVTEKHMGPLVKTVMTRCIHCTRCVRFAEEVAGVEDIGALYRGENMQITSYLERAVGSEVSGNIIDLCPVGALTAKPTAFNARPWELKRTDGIDVMDAVGSNITVHSRSGSVIRVTPRLNDDVNEEWLADHARFGVDGLRERRLDGPWVRVDGKLREASWAQAFAAIAARLAAPGTTAGALLGDLACLEETVALKDLMTGLGSAMVECRLDGATYGGAPANWRFNTLFTGLEQADAILFVGTNPRHDAPLLNTRIRKAVRGSDAEIFAIGPEVELTYPVTWLGDDLAALNSLPIAFLEAERPALLLASRAATASVLPAALRLPLSRDGWQGFNILHHAASRVGAMDVGFHHPGGLAAVAADVLFLLGADDTDLAPFAGAFKVYIGSHGDRGAAVADVILPAAAFTEQSGTWVNMEGRVQRSLRAVFPPGDAREGWTIFRALADVLGIRLPYDSREALRARIASEWPHLAQPGLVMMGAPALALEGAEAAPGPAGPVPRRQFGFYDSNPILRASPTMEACIREIVNGLPPVEVPVLEAAE
jgi:NADH-quinone oxidoreductase subunit G